MNQKTEIGDMCPHGRGGRIEHRHGFRRNHRVDGEQGQDRRIGKIAGDDGEDRTARDRTLRILEVAAHADPGRESRHGREKHRKDKPETLGGRAVERGRHFGRLKGMLQYTDGQCRDACGKRPP